MIVLNRLRATRFKQLNEIDLRFPEKGTVLIEGHNEAGKSSLFEAVAFALYGRPLINDRDYKIDHLKQYGADEMEVILDFSIDNRAFSVIRKFGKRHVARLILPAGDNGESETISVLSEIEKRLSEELRLSFDALLNTCFVEQKRLERLEDLNPNARQETINELLNLKVLTRLQGEFKVGGEDRSTLELQKTRVAIAALDDEWPRLQQRAEAARRCWLWAQWRDVETRARGWQTQISGGEETLQTLAQQRAEIEERLRSVALLHQRLSTLRGELTLAARAWQEADELQRRADERVIELQKLQSNLPARETQLAEYSALAARLEELENHEREAVVLQESSKRAQDELAERDAVQAAFDENRNALAECNEQRAAAQQSLRDAEAAHAARQAEHQRQSRLNLWLIQLEKWRETNQRESELAVRLESAQSAAGKLEAARRRLQCLQKARELARQCNEKAREIGVAQREVEAALQDLNRESERSRARAALRQERDAAQSRLRESELQHSAAQEKLRSAQLREALERWVAAHATAHEENKNGAPLESLAARETALQSSLESAQRNRESGNRARLRGLVLLGVSVAILVVAVIIGVASAVGMGLALLALTGAVAGGFMFANGAREASAAEREYSRLRSEVDSLGGERRALQAQAERVAQSSQREQQFREEAQKALLALGAAVPDSPAMARRQLESLPHLALASVRQEMAQSEKALQDARLQSGIAARALESHGDEDATDQKQKTVAAARQRLEQLQSARQALLAQMEVVASELGDKLNANAALSTLDEVALQNLLDAARGEFSAAENAASQLASLERALHETRVAAEVAGRECRETAGALGFEKDATEGDFASRARDELAALRLAQQNFSDEALAQNVAQARSTLGALENRISVLEAQQKQRHEQLEARPHEELVGRLNAARAAQAENDAELRQFIGVREELRAQNLPEATGPLQAALAAAEQSLQHAREEARRLPSAQESAAQARQKLETVKTQFAEIWRRVFSEAKAPEHSAMAEKALPLRAEQLQVELAAQREDELQKRLAVLQDEMRQCDQAIATWRHQWENAQAEIASLRGQLGADESQTLEEFTASCDVSHELSCASRSTPADWQAEMDARREATAHNRSTRRARADDAGVGEALLDLAQERESLREIDERIAVKRRAGEIVDATRASIVRRVMPLTMQNIRRLLPLLTDNRYQDAEWDEEKNWILIYDAQARELVRKRTFSGGARDQISLALRLSFALATLPSEHNTRPGFLFLDEPLSSFDRERTRALVDLLTRGLIRQRFEQIFLVSHSESFDPALFDFRLRMEHGRVALSTLPT